MINEAVASGLAVIATNIGGAAVELVRHRQNGLLVEPRSVVKLAEAMQEVVAGDAYLQMQKASSAD